MQHGAHTSPLLDERRRRARRCVKRSRRRWIARFTYRPSVLALEAVSPPLTRQATRLISVLFPGNSVSHHFRHALYRRKKRCLWARLSRPRRSRAISHYLKMELVGHAHLKHHGRNRRRREKGGNGFLGTNSYMENPN